jgi:dUTP pyrophosphatase
MRVKVKRLKQVDAMLPEYKTPGAAGFDLATAENVTIWPGQTQKARTGLVLSIPEGYFLMIAPRSSTWQKYGVRLGNSVGILDEDYSGPNDEVLLSLWKPEGSGFMAPSLPVTIPAGTRLAQGIIVPVIQGAWVEFEEVEEMEAPTRGGWGSTGD